MDTGIFIALINPGIALTFAATFLLLWHQRRMSHTLLLSASFLAVGIGFLLQYFTVYEAAASKLVSNLLFLSGGIGLAVGALARYQRTLPVRAIGVAGAGGFAAFAWFLYVQPDISARIYAINFAFGAITLLIAAELRQVENRKLIDNILFGLTLFWGLSFFVRPVLVLWIDGPYLDYAQYHSSLYWYTLTLSSALFMLLIALNVICATVLDVMDELKHESLTDPLSGLLNRRGFEDSARRELHHAAHRQMKMALIVCDLDHFKSINDAFGHAVGDEVIKCFARKLREGCDGSRIAGRIGGEEFSVLLRGVNESAARLFAEGVRAAFGALAFPGIPCGRGATASFGVAVWDGAESVEALSMRADAALYEAKKSGRDCVRMASVPARAAPEPLPARSR